MGWTKEKRAAYMREYRLKNLAKMRKRYKKYRLLNHKNILCSDRKYYAKNRNLRLAYARRYGEEHRVEIRRYTQARDAYRRTGLPLPLKILQKIYELNIKKFGTLTCYLCQKHILFGEDSLEHKIPIERGGDNSENNLEIAHLKCNKQKHSKTAEEYFLTRNLQIQKL